MKAGRKLVGFSINNYRLVTVIMVIFTLGLGALIPRITVDTDPENMLDEHEPVRIFHDQVKEQFNLYDMVVLGVVNEKNPEGVFNVSTLTKVKELADFARDLRWEDPENPDKMIGVVEVDLMAPSEVDHIENRGMIRFEWLMRNAPTTEAEALEVKRRALSNPLLVDTIFARDNKAIGLYIPITSKDLSYRVYKALDEQIKKMNSGDEEYHITGLPVAEDTFGVEMFVQMAISAPLAMAVIFILMLIFFRKLILIVSPMIIAMVSVISTMGLLIGMGFPVHIMSSMIPIFLMPIAVVDSVHILSEFFDRYTVQKGRRETILEVMDSLFMPMLYTSLTSAAGFASLALTPIPPVQVFGMFVAFGIMVAWLFTVAFVPAYIMMISEARLAGFGHAAGGEGKSNLLVKILHAAGEGTFRHAKFILAVLLLVVGVAIYGITKININDNPVKWFSKSHPIRQADIKLNQHFGGTYMAYLVLTATEQQKLDNEYVDELRNGLWSQVEQIHRESLPEITDAVKRMEKFIMDRSISDVADPEAYLKELSAHARSQEQAAGDDYDKADSWAMVADYFAAAAEGLRSFKNPATLRFVNELADHLRKVKSGDGHTLVGKTNSLADIVMKVHQELVDGKPENYRIPDSSRTVAECLFQYQSSHNRDDLWHFVTQDYNRANIWLQLTSGDNRDMEAVVRAADEFFAHRKGEIPFALEHRWAGLTYINIVWQKKMVTGMLGSFAGSFLVVFIMMAILFRSPLWGLLCMVPLTVTIAVIYGLVGLVGKDYDMPVAVLSSLTLGMAVDFAIHFLERARVAHKTSGSWQAANREMFGEPARAITRNVLVIAIGFLPLLAAPLVPYKTVGVLLCLIMALSGIVTLGVLSPIMKLAERRLFAIAAKPMRAGCNCLFCLVISIATVVLVAISVRQFIDAGWNRLAIISAACVPVLALCCSILSRRRSCRQIDEDLENKTQQ